MVPKEEAVRGVALKEEEEKAGGGKAGAMEEAEKAVGVMVDVKVEEEKEAGWTEAGLEVAVRVVEEGEGSRAEVARAAEELEAVTRAEGMSGAT